MSFIRYRDDTTDEAESGWTDGTPWKAKGPLLTPCQRCGFFHRDDLIENARLASTWSSFHRLGCKHCNPDNLSSLELDEKEEREARKRRIGNANAIRGWWEERPLSWWSRLLNMVRK